MTKSNESETHKSMNQFVGTVLAACQWVVRFEEQHADIVTFMPGRKGVWAVENERRANAYWIRRNATRNSRKGACGIVFVTETRTLEGKVNQIVNSLPEIVKKKVVVVSIEDFTGQFVKSVMERRQ